MAIDLNKPGLPPLEWLKSFEVAARLQNFTSAAEERYMTQASISQQMSKLESWLGCKLFHRLPRGVELTVEGEAYLPHITAAFNAMTRSTHDLFGYKSQRPIKIACPISVEVLWLAPKIALFQQLFPDVAISVVSIQRESDYDLESADIEIRFGRGDHPCRETIPLFPERLSPVSAPTLIQSHDWKTFPILSVTGPREGWSEWLEIAGIAFPSHSLLRFDNFLTAFQAAISEAGIVLASIYLIQNQLEAKSVVRLSDVEYHMSSQYWMYRTSRQSNSNRLDEVWDWWKSQSVD